MKGKRNPLTVIFLQSWKWRPPLMAQSVDPTDRVKPHRLSRTKSRPPDNAPTRGTHQGQRSCATASKGRTHDCKRPVLLTKITLAGWGPSTHEAASLKEKTPPERGSHGSIVAIKVRPWGARSTGSCRPAGRGRAAHSARSL